MYSILSDALCCTSLYTASRIHSIIVTAFRLGQHTWRPNHCFSFASIILSKPVSGVQILTISKPADSKRCCYLLSVRSSDRRYIIMHTSIWIARNSALVGGMT